MHFKRYYLLNKDYYVSESKNKISELNWSQQLDVVACVNNVIRHKAV